MANRLSTQYASFTLNRPHKTVYDPLQYLLNSALTMLHYFPRFSFVLTVSLVLGSSVAVPATSTQAIGKLVGSSVALDCQ